MNLINMTRQAMDREESLIKIVKLLTDPEVKMVTEYINVMLGDIMKRRPNSDHEIISEDKVNDYNNLERVE